MANFPFTSSTILRGHTSKETAFLVEDYPAGYSRRISIRFWLETKVIYGDRLVSLTINPLTHKENNPKRRPYSPFKVMYLDEKGHVKDWTFSPQSMRAFKEQFKPLIDLIGVDNITEDQRENIRVDHYNTLVAYSIRARDYYSIEGEVEFNKWFRAATDHVRVLPFATLADYPEPPAPDNI